jgi:hypothetical protein
MADEYIIADTAAIADELNQRTAREPERHTFIWLDHQKYHADDQTIALLWQIKNWDRSPDQVVAHVAFDHARQQGRVADGPAQQHELAHHERQPVDPDTTTAPSWSQAFKVGDRVVSSQETYDMRSTRQRVEPATHEHTIDPGGSL